MTRVGGPYAGSSNFKAILTSRAQTASQAPTIALYAALQGHLALADGTDNYAGEIGIRETGIETHRTRTPHRHAFVSMRCNGHFGALSNVPIEMNKNLAVEVQLRSSRCK